MVSLWVSRVPWLERMTGMSRTGKRTGASVERRQPAKGQARLWSDGKGRGEASHLLADDVEIRAHNVWGVGKNLSTYSDSHSNRCERVGLFGVAQAAPHRTPPGACPRGSQSSQSHTGITKNRAGALVSGILIAFRRKKGAQRSPRGFKRKPESTNKIHRIRG